MTISAALMLEALLQLLGALLLQMLGQALMELSMRSAGEPFRQQPSPWLAVPGATLFGAVLGGLSLLAFPLHFTSPGTIRIANLVLMPVAIGICMAILGALRPRWGAPVLRIDKFAYGYLFALALTLVRFCWAQ